MNPNTTADQCLELYDVLQISLMRCMAVIRRAPQLPAYDAKLGERLVRVMMCVKASEIELRRCHLAKVSSLWYRQLGALMDGCRAALGRFDDAILDRQHSTDISQGSAYLSLIEAAEVLAIYENMFVVAKRILIITLDRNEAACIRSDSRPVENNDTKSFDPRAVALATRLFVSETLRMLITVASKSQGALDRDPVLCTFLVRTNAHLDKMLAERSASRLTVQAVESSSESSPGPQALDPLLESAEHAALPARLAGSASDSNIDTGQDKSSDGGAQSSPNAALRHAQLREQIMHSKHRLSSARHRRRTLSLDQRERLDKSLRIPSEDHPLGPLVTALRKGADPDQDYDDIPWLPLQQAALRGHYGAVDLLIAAGANPASPRTSTHTNVWRTASPLQIAVYHGNERFTRHLLEARCLYRSESSVAKLLTPDNGLGALLNVAAASPLSDTDMIDLLLQSGADVNYTDPAHRSPLFSAIIGGFGLGDRPELSTWADSDLQVRKVRHLLLKGATPELQVTFSLARHQETMARIRNSKFPLRFQTLSILAESIGRHQCGGPHQVRSAYTALERRRPTYNTEIADILEAHGATSCSSDYLIALQHQCDDLSKYLFSREPGRSYLTAEVKAHSDWAGLAAKLLREAIYHLDVDLVITLAGCGITEVNKLSNDQVGHKGNALHCAVQSVAWRNFEKAHIGTRPTLRSQSELVARGDIIKIRAGRLFDALVGDGDTVDDVAEIAFKRKSVIGVPSRSKARVISPRELALEIALGAGSEHVDRKMLFRFAYE